MRATLKDVAERAGVSPSTVSRALSGRARVDPETRARIRSAIEALHYITVPATPDLSPRRTGMLGLLMPEGMQQMGMDTSVFAAILSSARTAAEAEGFAITVASYTDGPEFVTVGDRLLAQGQLEGAIVMRVRLSDEGFVRFRNQRLPFVVINSLFDRERIHCVGTDQAKCAVLATQHLLALGHRRIGFLSGQSNVHSFTGRIAGYRQALGDAGVSPRKEWIVECDGESDSAYTAALLLLRLPQPPTAVITANDRIAAPVIEAARALGLSVPEDVSVVGFDDAPEGAYYNPPLTTVRLEWAQMAELATRMLVEIIRRPAIAHVSVTLEPALVVRQSTAAPPAE